MYYSLYLASETLSLKARKVLEKHHFTEISLLSTISPVDPSCTKVRRSAKQLSSGARLLDSRSNKSGIMADLAFAPCLPALGATLRGSALVHRRPAARSSSARAPVVAALFGLGKKKPSSSGGPERREGPNPYRALGVGENATYEEVEAAVASLSVKYADDRKKLMMLDVHKDRIFEDRLQARMSGRLAAKVKESPYDKKIVKKKRFVVPVWLEGTVKLPNVAYLKRTAIIMGIFVVLGFATPTLVGSCMGMAFISAAGFLYNRGLPEPVKDEYGGVGEVRPVKHKIVLKTLLINLAMAAVFFGLGQLYMLYLPLPLWCPPDTFVNTCVILGLWISCLFFQAQDPEDLY